MCVFLFTVKILVLSDVSAMTSAHVCYITKFLCGQRHAPGEFWSIMIEATYILILAIYIQLLPYI